MTNYYIDAESGNDTANGLSPSTAVRTLGMGLDVLRAALTVGGPPLTGDAALLLKGSASVDLVYTIDSAGEIIDHTHDHYQPTARIKIGSYGAGRPWISGSSVVNGWVPSSYVNSVEVDQATPLFDLWSGGDVNTQRLRRAELGLLNPFYRVFEWDDSDPNQSYALISSALVPQVASYDGLIFVVGMGWSISYLRVNTIQDAGGGLSRVSFLYPGNVVERAKGVLGDPRLGTPFAYGPFHAAGQRFWWEGRPEFVVYGRGYWARDIARNRLVMNLPEGVSSIAELKALKVWRPNAATSGYLGIQGALFGAKVNRFDIEDVGFQHFGWSQPASEGAIGYAGGTYLTDVTPDGPNYRGTWSLVTAYAINDTVSHFGNTWIALRSTVADEPGLAGSILDWAKIPSIGFFPIPGVIEGLLVNSFAVRDCYFRDISTVPLKVTSCQHVVVERNIFQHIGSTCFLANVTAAVDSNADNSVDYYSFDDCSVSQQNLRLDCRDNLCIDVGTIYAGSALFIGPWCGFRVNNNTIIRATDEGIGIGTGARVKGIWTDNGLVDRNEIIGALTFTLDGGGIYANGNFSGRRVTTNESVKLKSPGLRIINNLIRRVLNSGVDPGVPGFPNTVAAVYLDLGCQGVIVAGNSFEDVEIAIKENCTGFNVWRNNRVIRAGKLESISYSGFEATSDSGGAFTSISYLPPVFNPPSVGDIANFNGTGTATGAFRDISGFAAAANVWKAGAPSPMSTPSDWYESTSIRSGNGPRAFVSLDDVGCPAEIKARLIGSARVATPNPSAFERTNASFTVDFLRSIFEADATPQPSVFEQTNATVAVDFQRAMYEAE